MADIAEELGSKLQQLLTLNSSAQQVEQVEDAAATERDVQMKLLKSELELRLQGVNHDNTSASPSHVSASTESDDDPSVVTAAALAVLPLPTRASIYFVKGKLLLHFGDDSQLHVAEALLAKAVKLDPRNLDAWNSLGETYTRLGNLTAARECFEGAIAQQPNAASLRDLSVILRKVGATAEEKAQNTRESLKRAKEAVALDFSDGLSWSILGNSYLSLFFSMSHKIADLDNALKAYKRAVQLVDDNDVTSADLFYNRAQVHKYLENYQEAIDDLSKAHSLDPKLGALAIEQRAALEQRRLIAAEYVAKKGKVKAKKLALIAKSFQESHAKPLKPISSFANFGPVLINNMVIGENNGKMLSLRIVTALTFRDPPISFLAMDSELNVCVLSVYHLDESARNKVKAQRDHITVLDPYLVDVSFEHKSVEHKYKLVQVRSPHNFFVNSNLLQDNFAHEAMATSSVAA